MKNELVFISYVTKNTPYEIVLMQHLWPSIKKWKVAHDIELIEDRKSWQENTAYKGEFVLKMLNKHKKDVCFLDSDAEIWKFPEKLYLIPDSCALACHVLDWYLFWRDQPNKDKKELLSGTMVFKYNEEGLRIAEKYAEACKNHNNVWEQKILQNILDQESKDLLYKLPASYCAIMKKDGSIPKYIGDPIVVHYQASRKLKR